VRQGATAADVGLREWLAQCGRLDGMPAAAFDTRVNRPRLTGSAARKAARELRRLGCRLVLPAEGFRVMGTTGPLCPGEEDRARGWGATLASSLPARQVD
jgi:hypothetical protein